MAERVDWPPPAEFIESAKLLLALMREQDIYFVDEYDPNSAFGYWRGDFFFTFHRNGKDAWIEIRAPLIAALKLWRATIGRDRPDPNVTDLYGRIREPGILYSLEADGQSWHMTRRDIESYAG